MSNNSNLTCPQCSRPKRTTTSDLCLICSTIRSGKRALDAVNKAERERERERESNFLLGTTNIDV